MLCRDQILHDNQLSLKRKNIDLAKKPFLLQKKKLRRDKKLKQKQRK